MHTIAYCSHIVIKDMLHWLSDSCCYRLGYCYKIVYVNFNNFVQKAMPLVANYIQLKIVTFPSLSLVLNLVINASHEQTR